MRKSSFATKIINSLATSPKEWSMTTHDGLECYHLRWQEFVYLRIIGGGVVLFLRGKLVPNVFSSRQQFAIRSALESVFEEADLAASEKAEALMFG